jgi:hypothetical protein
MNVVVIDFTKRKNTLLKSGEKNCFCRKEGRKEVGR